MPVRIDDFVVRHGSLLCYDRRHISLRPSPVLARKLRQMPPQILALYPDREHIAQTRPSSSEFIATNRNAPMRIRHGDRYRGISTARILFHDECGVFL